MQIVVKYNSNKLASNSDDKKCIFTADKEVDRRYKCNRAASTADRKRMTFTKVALVMPRHGYRNKGTSALLGAARLRYFRAREMDQCIGCQQWSQLVESCFVRMFKSPYPFQQLVVFQTKKCRGMYLGTETLHVMLVHQIRLWILMLLGRVLEVLNMLMKCLPLSQKVYSMTEVE